MRGRGGPPSRGGRGGFTSRGGGSGFRGGGRSGGFGFGSEVTPESVIEVGQVMHACQDELVCKCTLHQQVPYFNGRIFLQNKQEIGKIDEILGPIHQFMFSVKVNDSMKAGSFKEATNVYIDPNQILPLSRFLPKPPVQKGDKKSGSKGARGGRGGLGGGFSRGGRGGARGGFQSRGRGGSFSSRGGRGNSFSSRGRGSR